MADRSPQHSRESSYTYDHRPSQPSTLRQSYTAGQSYSSSSTIDDVLASDSTFHNENTESTPLLHESDDHNLDSTTSLHKSHSRSHPAHAGPCNHGTFSPRPSTPTEEYPFNDANGSESAGSETPVSGTTIAVLDNAISGLVGHDDWKKWLKRRMRTKKMGQSRELAHRAGFQDTPLM